MNLELTYGSVCSGMEAATVAWHSLGWKPAWFSEIDASANTLLNFRFPDVPNLGNMLNLSNMVRCGVVDAPDILVGGCPCQSFSLAGLRKGLIDGRGKLTLAYVDLANAIDEMRIEDGKEEAIVVYENVYGLLTDTTGAFGCFLAGLAGEDDEIKPSGKKWTNSGVVYGPQRTVAWRLLDSQYFGVAQRRRRLFVVASARKNFDPAEVLLEFTGLRRDHPPRRKTSQDTTAAIGRSPAENSAGQPDTRYVGFDLTARMLGFGHYSLDNTASTLKARDFKDATDLVISVHGTQDPDVRTEHAHTLGRNYGQENALAIPIHDKATRWSGGGPTRNGDGAANGLGIGKDGDPIATLDTSCRHAVAIPLDLRNANRDPEKYDRQNRQGVGVGAEHDPSPTMTTGAVHGVSYDMIVRRLTPIEGERLQGFPDNWTLVPQKKVAKKYLQNPREGYQYIEMDGECWQLMPDSQRYKMIGNSMTTTVMNWIGRRICLVLETQRDLEKWI